MSASREDLDNVLKRLKAGYEAAKKSPENIRVWQVTQFMTESWRGIDYVKKNDPDNALIREMEEYQRSGAGAVKAAAPEPSPTPRRKLPPTPPELARAKAESAAAAPDYTDVTNLPPLDPDIQAALQKPKTKTESKRVAVTDDRAKPIIERILKQETALMRVKGEFSSSGSPTIQRTIAHDLFSKFNTITSQIEQAERLGLGEEDKAKLNEVQGNVSEAIDEQIKQLAQEHYDIDRIRRSVTDFQKTKQGAKETKLCEQVLGILNQDNTFSGQFGMEGQIDTWLDQKKTGAGMFSKSKNETTNIGKIIKDIRDDIRSRTPELDTPDMSQRRSSTSSSS